jgi:hypothetical protein
LVNSIELIIRPALLTIRKIDFVKSVGLTPDDEKDIEAAEPEVALPLLLTSRKSINQSGPLPSVK